MFSIFFYSHVDPIIARWDDHVGNVFQRRTVAVVLDVADRVRTRIRFDVSRILAQVVVKVDVILPEFTIGLGNLEGHQSIFSSLLFVSPNLDHEFVTKRGENRVVSEHQSLLFDSLHLQAAALDNIRISSALSPVQNNVQIC